MLDCHAIACSSPRQSDHLGDPGCVVSARSLAAGAESSESVKVAEATDSVATPESVAASGEDIASEAAQASTRPR